MEVKDMILHSGARKDIGRKAKPPRPTKHIKKTNPKIIDKKIYLSHKKPLPNIKPLNLQIRQNLINIHNTEKLKQLKRRTILTWQNFYWLQGYIFCKILW